MGVPGKVIRQLDDAARAANLASARHYRERMRHFRTALKPSGQA
jgi:carbonic anhydrase/acetyltransferase-like protein (isoleucine patch superfamily)